MALDYIRTNTDGGEGFRYETKMTALVALRLFNDTPKFYLASNMMLGGKFDDVVYSAQKGDAWETSFIQLKHKQVNSLSKKKITIADLQYKSKDFNVLKYYDSFQTVRRKFQIESNDPIFNKGFQCSKFVVYTNAVFHNEVSNGNEINCTILNTSEKNGVNLQFDPRSDIFNNIRDNGSTHFADKLMFFSSQANENEIDKIIIDELKKALTDKKVEQSALKLILHEWIDFIQKRLCTSDTTTRYLVHAEVKNILKRLSGEAKYGKKHEISIKFLDAFLESVHGQLGSDKFIYLTSYVDTTVMCLAALKQMGFAEEPNTFITLPDVCGDRSLITKKWFNGTNLTFVVDCEVDTLNVDLKSVSEFFIHLKALSNSNRIILVATSNNESAKSLSLSVNAKKKKFNCSLKNFSDDSKKMFKEREVYFQGYKIQLESVMPHNKGLDDVFDLSAITQLVHGRQLNVGLKPVDEKSYYVTRVLIRQATVHPNTLLSPDFSSSFAVSGISHEDAISYFENFEVGSFYDIISCPGIQLTQKVIALSDLNPEKEFGTLVKTVQAPLHWFDKSKRGWQWKQSSANVEEVIKNVTNQDDFVPTNNIMKIRDKIVVVIAEPGMGKSTLLEHLAAETKRQCPHMWVIMLTLSDYTSAFTSTDFAEKAAEHTKNLLSQAAGIDSNTSKFNERLFNQCYENGNMIVLLDGFDEITPQFTKQGLAMISALRKSPISRVWVSARPVVMDILESITSTISYSIKPFSQKDQTTFLKKYWQSQIPLIEMEKLNIFVEKLLATLSKSFDDKLQQFTGIPLQTLMIAEIFQEDLNNYHSSGQLRLKERLDGLQLFAEFVRIKQRSYLNKSKILNALTFSDLKLLEEIREKELMSMALLTLLPMSACENLVPGLTKVERDRLKAKVLEGSEKMGIVLSFNKDSPQFIHRTFAEYFVALFFSKNYATNRKFLSSDTFFSKAFEFVKYFFDRILCVGKGLHEATLDNDDVKLRELLSSCSQVNVPDLGGRTVLHLAASQPHSGAMITLLLEAGADINLHDFVFDWSPLEYATLIKSAENIGPLLERSNKSLKAGAVPTTWETLLIAVTGDYLKLFLYLLDNGIYDEECLDVLSPKPWLGDFISEGLTILHLTSFYDADKILQFLLRKDSRDSKIMLIESLNDVGETPLIVAASKGHSTCATTLLNAGANGLVKDGSGANLCQYAVQSQDLQLLCEAIADATVRRANPTEFLSGAITVLLSDVSDWGEHALALLLSLYPTLVTTKTSKGMSPITLASIKGNLRAIKTLKSFGADLNELSANGTPLHLAIIGGNEDIVKDLLAASNIKVDIIDNNGLTPLYVAVARGKVEIYNMLVEAGANVNFCTPNGSNLAHAIADPTFAKHEILLDLIRKKIDFYKVNDFGESAFSLLQKAKAYEFLSIIDPTVMSPENPDCTAQTNETKKKKKKMKKTVSAANTEDAVERSDVEKFISELKQNNLSGENKDDVIAKIQELVKSVIKQKKMDQLSSTSSQDGNKQKKVSPKNNEPRNLKNYANGEQSSSTAQSNFNVGSLMKLKNPLLPIPPLLHIPNTNLIENRQPNRSTRGVFNNSGRNQIQNYRANYGQNLTPNVSKQSNRVPKKNNQQGMQNINPNVKPDFGNNQGNVRQNYRGNTGQKQFTGNDRNNKNGGLNSGKDENHRPNFGNCQNDRGFSGPSHNNHFQHGQNNFSQKGNNQNPHSDSRNNPSHRPNHGQMQNPYSNQRNYSKPEFTGQNYCPNPGQYQNYGPSPNFNHAENNYCHNAGQGQTFRPNGPSHDQPFNAGQNRNYRPIPGPSQDQYFNSGQNRPNPGRGQNPNFGPSQDQYFNSGQNSPNPGRSQNPNFGPSQDQHFNSGQNRSNPGHGLNPNFGPNPRKAQNPNFKQEQNTNFGPNPIHGQNPNFCSNFEATQNSNIGSGHHKNHNSNPTHNRRNRSTSRTRKNSSTSGENQNNRPGPRQNNRPKR